MELVSQGIIYDAQDAPPDARFASFPALEQTLDGRLLAAFRVGSSKDSVDEDVRVMASGDGGLNWQMVFGGFGDVPPGRGRMRALAITAHDNGLFGALTWIDRSDPTRPLANPETQGLLASRVMMAESSDGAAWRRLQALDLAPLEGCVTTGAILRLHSGALALPFESWKRWDDTRPGEHRAALQLSHDHGHTWTEVATVAHDPSGQTLFWDQRVTIHPVDGRLVAMFWSHDRAAQQDAPIHIAWGAPDGRSWSAARPTGIVGQICAPLVLPDGSLLACYVHRHEPPGLWAVLSHDEGSSWDRDGALEFYRKRRRGAESGISERRDFSDYWADMSIWTFGHPAPLLLPDGDVLVAYYAGDDQSMSVCWARLRVQVQTSTNHG